MRHGTFTTRHATQYHGSASDGHRVAATHDSEKGFRKNIRRGGARVIFLPVNYTTQYAYGRGFAPS